LYADFDFRSVVLLTNISAITLSSDGTSHRSIKYVSHHFMAMSGQESTPKRYILPLTTLDDHSSAAQLDDWKSILKDVFKIAAPVSTQKNFGVEQWREVVGIIRGAASDHANDQKKLWLELFTDWKRLVDRETRGNKVLQSLTPLELLQLVHVQLQQENNPDDPAHSWDDTLPLDEQARFASAAFRSVCFREGEKAYNSLEPEEQLAIDWMVWCGCCGHKSSNATAAGFAAMSAAWVDIPDAAPPIKLLNRDTAAAAARATAHERTQLYSSAKGGAKKTVEIWGAMCKNKDDKKGYQDMYSNAFEVCMSTF
jgi:hypothetical protein